jgi:hypothetical protein
VEQVFLLQTLNHAGAVDLPHTQLISQIFKDGGG